MPVSGELLGLLRCPESGQRLSVAGEATLEAIRSASSERTSLECALVREDGKRAYPVRDGFPILLIRESIALESGPGASST